MATVTNKTLNTATVINKSLLAVIKVWADAIVTWGDSGTDWATLDINNKSLNTATVTNKALN